MVYQKASDVFFQWKDVDGKVFGLNFHSADEAQVFAKTVDDIILSLLNQVQFFYHF